MERIEADLLIPGRGAPVQNGVVVLDGPTITYSGPAAEAPPGDRGHAIVRVAVAMPGSGTATVTSSDCAAST
jgi:hypothetical protein